MQDTARVVVLKSTDLLADRLEPIISARLAPHLGKSSWTEFLAELDAMKGSPSIDILAHDLRSQLRMLSEKLGSLQFPFDDERRTASTTASELLNVQRALVSNSPFSWLDAARATDLVVRLLKTVGDDEGAARAVKYRSHALREHAHESDLAPTSTGRTPSAPTTPTQSSTTAGGASRKTPEPSRNDESPRPYVPWLGREAGSAVVLDTLRRRESAAQVHALAQEIVAYEWPIEIGRLCQEVIRSFGVTRAFKDRMRKVRQTILRSGVHLDDDGFVWPSAEAREAWSAFRYDPPGTARPFEEISLREIRNAITAVQHEHPNAPEALQKRKVLAIFGRERQTAGVKSRLSHAWD